MMKGLHDVTTVLVPDPDALLLPYAEERRVALAAGADFIVGDEGLPHLHDADAIITSTMLFPAELLRGLERCRLIVRSGIGVDTIDVAAATECGIVIANAPTFCVHEVADHTAALILSFARRIPWLDGQARAGAWFAAQGGVWGVRRLSSLTVGVIGLGKIGQQLALRMASFGCRILGYDANLADDVIRAAGATPMTFESLLRRSDFVSVHVPLVPATRGLIDEAALQLMKPTAVVINTSRGPVVDEAALIRAIQGNRLYGAALDVLEAEPPDPGSPLLTLDRQRVILTPHFASVSEEAMLDLHREVSAALEAILHDQWPATTINSGVTPKKRLRPGNVTSDR